MNDVFLFVYGTLRPGFDGPMAVWLRSVAPVIGPATARGALYRVERYPGFVPGDDSAVTGDLFALPDPVAVLARLDEYEECAAHFPVPHEYRRGLVTVMAANGPVEAWTYIYARDVAGLERIASGDFLGGSD